MGHIATPGSGLRYWHPTAGCLFSNCRAEDEGAEPYVPAKGKYAGQTRYRQKSYGYVGKITNVAIVPSEYGDKLQITFDKDTVIACDASGSYFLRFANICEQLDPAKPAQVTPWSMPNPSKPDKTIVGWVWKQGGVKLTPPDELNPSNKEECTLPEPRDVKINGKMAKDWTERDEVLKGIIERWATQHGLWGVPAPRDEEEAPQPQQREEEEVY